MIKRLPAKLLFVAVFVFLIGCSTHPASINSAPAKQSSTSASANGSAPSAASQSSAKQSAKLVGLAVAVIDGDTIDVLDEQHAKSRIRLQGIDAPEKQQAFGNVSRQNLATLVAGKIVQVEWQKRDRYGRLVGKVFLESEDVCLDQIKAGLAWHYKEYEDEQSETDRVVYADAEQTARSQKLGLWHDASPIQPSEFRHHKDGTEEPPAGSSATSSNARSSTAGSSAAGPPTHSASSSANAEAEGSIRGNRNSKKYFWPGCPNYDQIAPRNRVIFRTREEAEQAGYVAAKNCR